MIGRKKRSITEPHTAPRRPERARIPFGLGIRMFLLGSVAVIAAAWAVWRHYSAPRTPMVVPAPSASEIEIEP